MSGETAKYLDVPPSLISQKVKIPCAAVKNFTGNILLPFVKISDNNKRLKNENQSRYGKPFS